MSSGPVGPSPITVCGRSAYSGHMVPGDAVWSGSASARTSPANRGSARFTGMAGLGVGYMFNAHNRILTKLAGSTLIGVPLLVAAQEYVGS